MSLTLTLNQIVNPYTKELKLNLASLGHFQPEKLKTALTSILLPQHSKLDKALLHLQLFLHLPFQEELEPLLDDLGDFTYLGPPPVLKTPLDLDLYSSLVLDCDLLPHFLQTALSLGGKFGFVRTLVQKVLTALTEDEDKEPRLEKLVLSAFMLGKLCRKEREEDDCRFYLTQLFRILGQIVAHGKLMKYEKLDFLCRLSGVSCMQTEDYTASGSELVELLEEWSFDPTSRSGEETATCWKMLLGDGKRVESSLLVLEPVPVKTDVLQSIEETVIKLSISPEDEEEWKTLKKTHRITWSEFLGVVAFLTKSLLRKYDDSVGSTAPVPKLMELLERLESTRAKLTMEDFVEEMTDFSSFYKVLKRFGEKERDREMLLKKFVNYPYNDVFNTKDGLKVAEKYLIPGADYDTVEKYVLRSFSSEQRAGGQEQEVPEVIRLMIQKLLCTNPAAKLRGKELIQKIFQDGTHTKLCLRDFTYHLNLLCLKIGSMEREEKDFGKLEHDREVVRSVCVQDPLKALESIVKHSIVSQHFKVLEYAEPFMVLTSKKTGSLVRNEVFDRILSQTDEHDHFFQALCDSIARLISSSLFDKNELRSILQKRITSLFVVNPPHLKKIVKLFQVLQSLLNAVNANSKDQNFLKAVREFTLRSMYLTFGIYSKTHQKEVFHIRIICKSMLETLEVEKGQDCLQNAVADVTDMYQLPVKTLLAAGLLYCRVPDIRKVIVTSFFNAEEPPLCPTELEKGCLQQTLLSWAQNLGAEEWTTIYEFCVEVVAKSPHIEASFPNLFNLSLLFMWDDSMALEKQTAFRHYIKFFNGGLKYFIKKGILSWENQTASIDTTVVLVKQMFQSMRRRKSASERSALDHTTQQVLLSLLELLNVVIERSPEEVRRHQQDVTNSIFLLPSFRGRRGGCNPIRKCLIDRIMNLDSKSLTNPLMGIDDKEGREGVPDLASLLKLGDEKKVEVV